MTTPDVAAMPDEPRLLKLLELFEAAEVESSYTKREALKWQAYEILGQLNYEYKSRADKPHAEAVRVLHAALKRFTDEIPTGWDDDHHPFSDEVDQAYKAQAHPAVVAAMSSAEDE